MRILLVEDDDSITRALKKVLLNEHYVVDIADDGQIGWQLVEAFTYDLILLDVVLPKLDGIQFCRQLRSQHYQTPVLLLTAQHSSAQRVTGLDAGADDYVVKPFEIEELLARIRVLLRRGNAPVLTMLEWKNLRLNPNTREVTYHRQPLYLTPKEYRILELFLRKQNHVFTRNDILESLWTINETPNEDTVTAHIKGLRHKLKQAGAASDFIETVYGVGYRLKPLETIKADAVALSNGAKHLSNGKISIQQQTKAALAEVWQKSRKQNNDRLNVLKQASKAILKDALPIRLQQQAQLAAHKLAGALGVFGFNEGSRLAADIEQRLAKRMMSAREKHQIADLVQRLEQELQNPDPLQLLPMPYQAPILLLIDDDRDLAEGLITLAKARDIKVYWASSIEALRAIQVNPKGYFNQHHLENSSSKQISFHSHAPDVVLLNLALKQIGDEQLRALIEKTNQPPPMPVLLCTADGSLANRVRAARLDAYAFLQKPAIEQVIEVLTTMRSLLHKAPAKILVVDDDPQFLSSLRALLEPWGLSLTTLEQPPQFWDMLETCSPDLLVLDIEMPDFNGIDLCRVVRHTPAWQKLPILFLTVHNDAQIEHQAFAAGANAFINKSLVQSELVTRILSQLERLHLQQAMMVIENSGFRAERVERVKGKAISSS